MGQGQLEKKRWQNSAKCNLQLFAHDSADFLWEMCRTTLGNTKRVQTLPLHGMRLFQVIIFLKKYHVCAAYVSHKDAGKTNLRE